MHYLSFTDREAWRAWLAENHTTEREVWLAFYKKHTGKDSVSYMDSVKEALCFGWIDGLKRRIDEERYAHRFTPRKPTSRWSPQNIRLAQELIESGEMTPPGLTAFEQRVNYDKALQTMLDAKEIPLDPETEEGLKTSKKAWNNFNLMAPGYRKQYVAWLQTAKKPETRKRRLQEAIKMLEENQKPGMK